MASFSAQQRVAAHGERLAVQRPRTRRRAGRRSRAGAAAWRGRRGARRAACRPSRRRTDASSCCPPGASLRRRPPRPCGGTRSRAGGRRPARSARRGRTARCRSGCSTPRACGCRSRARSRSSCARPSGAWSASCRRRENVRRGCRTGSRAPTWRTIRQTGRRDWAAASPVTPSTGQEQHVSRFDLGAPARVLAERRDGRQRREAFRRAARQRRRSRSFRRCPSRSRRDRHACRTEVPAACTGRSRAMIAFAPSSTSRSLPSTSTLMKRTPAMP